MTLGTPKLTDVQIRILKHFSDHPTHMSMRDVARELDLSFIGVTTIKVLLRHEYIQNTKELGCFEITESGKLRATEGV